MEGTSRPDRPISPRTTISPAGWLGAVGTQPSGSVLQLLKVLLTWARRTCLDPAILPPPSAFPRHGLERTRVGGRGKRGGREGGGEPDDGVACNELVQVERCEMTSWQLHSKGPFFSFERGQWCSGGRVPCKSKYSSSDKLRLASAEDPRERRSPRLDRAGDRGQDMARPHEVRCRPAAWYITGRHDGVDEMRPKAWRYVHDAYLSIAGLLPTVSPFSRTN